MDTSMEGLHSRAESLLTKFEQGDGVDCLDEAIALEREVLGLCLDGHSKRAFYLSSLSLLLSTRYNHLGAMQDLEEAIILGREALALRPSGHLYRSTSLSNLAVRLANRYNQLGTIQDLDEAIVLGRDALVLCPSTHPHRSTSLSHVATHLSARYDQLGVIQDLDEAIALDQEALALCPPGHPGRSTSLSNLAVHLSTRYDRLGGMQDINEAIVLGRDVLALSPLGDTDRPTSLSNLAAHLATRYSQLGAMQDLDEAIALGRNALEVCPPGHPDRLMSLSNFAAHLALRYDQLGAIQDLNEAIALDRDALALCPSGHLDRPMSLSNLAAHLATRYDQFGAMQNLDEAIVLDREALALRPPGHPGRSTSMSNLGVHLSTRYDQIGTIQDLDEAIILGREALAFRPSGHPGRSKSLSHLAVHLSTRYDQLGAMQDLDEAIVLDREALALCLSGHPDRPISLINLGADISTQYKQLGVMSYLDEAIVLGRDALALCPSGHPYRSTSLNNLAIRLSTRYEQSGAMQDLDEAISLGREALALRPPGHPDWSMSLEHLANHLHSRFRRSHSSEDKEELFGFYTQLAHGTQMVFSADLSAARAWIRAAEDYQHPTTLLAYETSLRFLTYHLATLPSLPRHLNIFKGHASSLAVDAFSACLRNNSPTRAVELLEQGRGVFLSQLARLRSPLEDVIVSGSDGSLLADKFKDVTTKIQNALKIPAEDQHDRLCRLNLQLEKVVASIRELPGLSRFLLPSLFSDLQQAACEGPVVIVNASGHGCDALIVLFNRDPVHIPLSVTREGVRELSSRLYALIKRAKFDYSDVTKELSIALRKLWDEVVYPIFDSLQTVCPPGSRIWWCPTGEFSLLPLHAAAPFRTSQQKLANLYVSSYTPTLTALIRARRQDHSHTVTKMKRFMAIGQATPTGEKKLISVGTELEDIGQRINGLATFTRIEGAESCIARVTEELGKSDWVHFACHGTPNRQHPFESAFVLHDGRFTIQKISQCNLENPEFAYLSACHTTVGDEESPDEVIHLASMMQFSGFRSVIGTMWAVDDAETARITSTFYDCIKDGSGRLDYTRAALALNRTMKKLTKNVPLDQRILYIHIGA